MNNFLKLPVNITKQHRKTAGDKILLQKNTGLK